ncbi:hypothetical protein [Halopiger xanaduensis]|uniref:Uncharacterized protein n=1 Tax=Halopiger xanaduensis (strain DSM 18323 / JCM 14033 / SH-6) TaxID=797210 RepID=F8D5P0_HALXS|nr:hypothetical protein [Halopiger xanaduensis]AEH36462.1 hypothetical protein Halxa_1834 [Halopiger xanaduensis SH-6]
MSAAFVVLVLLFAVLIPLVLWVAIEGETSNATVMDRTDAERIAKERGGRSGSRSNGSASETWAGSSESDREYTIADRVDDDSDAATGWGTPPEERGTGSSWSDNRDEGTRDDRNR